MLGFGNRLKSLRMQKALSQEQLADRLGVTRSLINAYETSRRFPSLDMLIKLAYSFNVSTDYLLGVDKTKKIDISELSDEHSSILRSLIEQFKKTPLAR